ncbi:hypothetical protein I302_103595 [Kwoniella bestiolae CBS 10118]|uniref:Uncharacterized protein n=1 Tax=Kwoniella bestiolae CBS 10118 TaxID=1296100 RepID=A0A1B9G8U1_9TREE|nr:hypothetical protein I302_02296 [Kwoniella bestiolae CBS 10118]OCF27454.1 hypothetical protein I302_02296 [Kwoniella bestiolae CBS 10118]
MSAPPSSIRRSAIQPSHLSFSLNFRAISHPFLGTYTFDHDHTLNPPAEGFSGEAYQAMSALTCASDESVQDWLRSDESKSYISNNDNFHTDDSGHSTILSSIHEGLKSTFAARAKPLLQAYKIRTRKSVDFQVTFDKPPSIGPFESALQSVKGPKGPPTWVDPSPSRCSRFRAASEYGDGEDDDLSGVDVSSGEEEDDDSNSGNTPSQSSGTKPTAKSVLLDKWRTNVHGATTSRSIVTDPPEEPPESGFKLKEGELPGEGMADEASADVRSSSLRSR